MPIPTFITRVGRQFSSLLNTFGTAADQSPCRSEKESTSPDVNAGKDGTLLPGHLRDSEKLSSPLKDDPSQNLSHVENKDISNPEVTPSLLKEIVAEVAEVGTVVLVDGAEDKVD